MTLFRTFICLCFAFNFIPSSVCAVEAERAVVQIINFAQHPDWIEPWRFSRVGKSTGSGFVIEGNRVMTNAHVVSWSKQILVRRYQDPKPYPAEIEYIGHDCDLAVLKVLDPAFYEGIESLPIGELPEVRSTVTTYGYPAGGDQISYTRGVISRIEMQRYVHIANRSLLTVQTDAAINPGNSGGPAIQDDKVVGVSFQGNPALENAGFFIPPNVIRHFLKDVEDGVYDGFPDAGIGLVPLQNPAFRAFLGLDDDGVGARIDSLYHPFPRTHEVLRENDVILAVNGQEVGSDGMIQYKGNRVHSAILFDDVQNGESLDLSVWRDRAAVDVSVEVYRNWTDHTSGNRYDNPPPYLLAGGLVFTEFSRNYLSAYGGDWQKSFSAEEIYELLFRQTRGEADARSVPIVLSKIINHPTNIDFSVGIKSIVTAVNGENIGSMEDLVNALAANEGEYHRFEFLSGREEALNREAVDKATDELMKTYRIPSAYRLGAIND